MNQIAIAVTDTFFFTSPLCVKIAGFPHYNASKIPQGTQVEVVESVSQQVLKARMASPSGETVEGYVWRRLFKTA